MNRKPVQQTISCQKARLVVLVGALVSAGAGACVVLLAWFVVNTAQKTALAKDVWTAGWLLWLAGLPGLILAVWLTGKVRGGASIGFIAGIVVRMPVGGMLALNGLNWNLSSTPSFSNVVAFGYLVLLTIEVVFFGPAAKKAAAAISPSPPTQLSVADDGDQADAALAPESKTD